MIRVQKVRLYPNQTMKKVLDDLCDYRRYCWNKGLALWNDMYDSYLILNDEKLKPNWRKVRDELVANKEDWQYQLSPRCLQLAISDLGKAWSNFLTKLRQTGVNLSLNLKRMLGKDLKQIERRLSTVN